MRKRIAVLTINPENEHQKETLWGIFNQCKKVDYDVCVFSPMVQVCHYYKDYLEGELNIYELINYDLFDGVIVMPVPMTEDQVSFLTDHLLQNIKKQCKKPVISLESEFGDFPVVSTDNVKPFEDLTEHLISEHGITDITILTGMKDYSIAEDRVKGCMNALKRHDINTDMIEVYYGNFWYDAGEKLADDIANGVVHRPKAVIATSDHMAIGLVSRFRDYGISVPEDIIVTGYGASKEAIIYTQPITSYSPDEAETGARAVNALRSLIEPECIEAEPFSFEHAGICLGGTCGCKEDIRYTRGRLSEFLYLNERNYGENGDIKVVDIGMFQESYTSEILTKTETVNDCLNKIYESLYLIKPYEWFYLCLTDNWLLPEDDRIKGYPRYMKKVIISDMAKRTHGYVNHVFHGHGRDIVFDTKDMLPEIQNDFGKPQVFFFMPLHFNERTLGYAVLQNELDQWVMPGLMFKNYLRVLSNALEMTRTRNKIMEISEHDLLTGLYNRRGMSRLVEKLQEEKTESNRWMTIVIDMDGLKKINDNYGHSFGDEGIGVISRAAKYITKPTEICVRAGGDEFYIFGLGEYTDAEMEERLAEFAKFIKKENSQGNYELVYDASIGYELADPSEEDPMDAIARADAKMYIMKNERKSARQ